MHESGLSCEWVFAVRYYREEVQSESGVGAEWVEDAGDVWGYGDGDYWVLYFVFGYAVKECLIPFLGVCYIVRLHANVICYFA